MPSPTDVNSLSPEGQKRLGTQPADQMAALRDLLHRYAALRMSLPADYNTFSLLSVQKDEVRHNRFLGWLLDADADHRQGPLFMRAFAQACGACIAVNGEGNYRVRTEYSGLEAIVDIMVYRRGDFLIYIENKVDAEEGKDQLAREYRDMVRVRSSLSVPTERCFAVFLTPDGREPTTTDGTDWVALSHATLADEFEAVVPGVSSDKVKHLVEDWVATVRDWRKG